MMSIHLMNHPVYNNAYIGVKVLVNTQRARDAHIINTLCRLNGRVCSRPQIKKFKLHLEASMRRTTITALESRIKQLKRLMFIYYYRFTTYT